MHSSIAFKEKLLSRSIAFALGLVASVPATANPNGLDVVSGSATLANPNPATLEITNSPGAILNWQNFDIGAGEVTRFMQQSADSAVLNRVTAADPSEIYGQMLSNGRVFLVNPAGILIGRDAVIDTAGLVLSTLNIRNEDFTAGKFTFTGDANSGRIENHGYIKSAPNGEIILIAPKILNAPEAGNPQSGIIEAENGELLLAAGYALTISSLDDPDISFDVQAPGNEVVNLGQLIAKGGTASILAGTIKHSGEINADSLTMDEQGRIVLRASDKVETTFDSKLLARGATGAAGGEVTVEGKVATVSGVIDVSGDTQGGTAHVLGDEVKLTVATVSANATSGAGGNIRVGGEYKGGAALRAAEKTLVDANSKLEANAGTNGRGGTIVTWSNQETEFRAAASARGGAEAGDGGLVEVSGKEILRMYGGADVGAPHGKGGTLLLDPRRIFLIPGGATTSVFDQSANANDQLGSFATSITPLANGNILVINQNANNGAFTQAGKVLLLDSVGNTLGSLSGNGTNEFLGGSFFNAPNGNRLFLSENATANGLLNAGAVILFNLTTGQEIGRTSGTSASEFFGDSVQSIAGNFVVESDLADVNGANSGSVVTVSGLTGLEIGRISGGAAGDQFGSSVAYNFSTNTFRIEADNATIGGQANAGAVVVGSAVTGAELGRIVGGAANDRVGQVVTDNFGLNTFRIDAGSFDLPGKINAGAVITGSMVTGQELGRITGNAADDAFGTNVQIFGAAANTFRIVATAADNGLISDAGAVIIGSSATGAELGRTMGQSDLEGYGSNIFFDSFGKAPAGKMIVTSSSADLGGTGNGFDDAGTAVLIDKATGLEIGRTNGLSAGDLLGSFDPIMRASGNYFLQVPDANGGQGSLVLVDGSTGARLASVDGNAAGENLGSVIDQSSLGFGDLLLISEDHTNGLLTLAGAVFVVADQLVSPGVIVRGATMGVSTGEQFGKNGIEAFLTNGMVITSETADTGVLTNNGRVALVGYNGNFIGAVEGTSDNEALGQDGIIESFVNDNYWIPSRLWDPIPSTPNLGSIILADGSTGAEIGRFDGDTNNEQFGALAQITQGALSNGDLVVKNTGANSHNGGQGIVVQLAATDLGGGVIKRGTGVTGSGGGGGLTGAVLDFSVLDNFSRFDDYVVRAPGNGGNSEGSVIFMSGATGNILRQIDGSLPSEGLGGRPLVAVPGGNLAIQNPGAGGGAGEIHFVDANSAGFVDSGLVTGLGAGEGLGDVNTIINTSTFIDTGNLFAIHTPNRDAFGTDSGAILLMSGLGGSVTLLGAISGSEINDRLGAGGANDIQRLTAAGNTNKFLVFDADADDPGGTPGDGNHEGVVILADFTGAELGRQYGQTDNERLGDNAQNGSVIERSNGNLFRRSVLAGNNDEGTMYLFSGADLSLIGQVDGTLSTELFGQLVNSFALSNGDILVSGNSVNGGAIVQIADLDLDTITPGGQIERGRITPGANEVLDPFDAFMAPDNAHWVLGSTTADYAGANSGSAYFMNVTTGAQTNRIDGLSAGDGFGGSISYSPNGNLIFNNFAATVGGNANAGRYLVANSSGGIVGELRGNTLNEFLGSSQLNVAGETWIRAPLHNSGAGALFVVGDQDLGGGNLVKASLLGATGGGNPDGVGAFSPLSFIGMDPNTRFLPVPDMDANGLTDSGSLLLVNSMLQIIGRTDGTSALERFSADNIFSVRNFLNGNNDIIVESPLADVGSFSDAGAIVQVNSLTGLEVQRAVGISNLETLGNANVRFTVNQRIAFGSPLADVNGVIDAGRLVFFDPFIANSGIPATSIPFSNTPSGDFVVTSGSLALALNAGANLVLQANEDIFIDKGFVLSATGGSLTLQAGRSIIINGLLNMPNTALTLTANESSSNGVDLQFRGAGDGDFKLFDPMVIAKSIRLSAQNAFIEAGTDPLSQYILQTSQELVETLLLKGTVPGLAAFLFGLESLTADIAQDLNIIGGGSPGAFAALMSGGEFIVNANHINLEAGTAPGAHALLAGLGGQGEFNFQTCTGCGETLLFEDPFLQDGPFAGRFISGIFQDPAISAILAMLGKGVDDEDDDDEDDDDSQECGI